MPSTVNFKELDVKQDIIQILKVWNELSCRSNHHFFLSEGWISCWLELLPESSRVKLVYGEVEDKVVVGFFVGQFNQLRNKFVFSKGLHFNVTGDEYLDELTLEYNEFLFTKDLGDEQVIEITRQALRYLDHQLDYNELFLPGSSDRTAKVYERVIGDDKSSWKFGVCEEIRSYCVDLKTVREKEFNFLSLLSSNRRSQIRRSIKEYEKKGGSVVIEDASTVKEALEMYHRMAEFHQIEWEKRGEPGSFSNSFLYQFHEKLIQALFDKGQIQLLRVSINGNELGYLYNFLYNNRVYFYQSGLQYTDNNKLRPGMVSHYLAILFNAEKGFDEYDFLAGDSQYKSSLSTHYNTMHWLVIQKKAARFAMESALRAVKHKLIKMGRKSNVEETKAG